MKKRNILALVAATFALCMGSCQKPDDKENYPQMEMAEGSAIVVDAYQEHDPAGAYPLSFSITRVGDKFVVEGGVNQANQAAIELGVPSSTMCTSTAAIANAGEFSSLKAMSEIAYPAFGDATETPIVVENGYVVKVWGSQGLDQYQKPGVSDTKPLYIRLYVAELTEAGTYTVRYQYPFVPEE